MKAYGWGFHSRASEGRQFLDITWEVVGHGTCASLSGEVAWRQSRPQEDLHQWRAGARLTAGLHSGVL